MAIEVKQVTFLIGKTQGSLARFISGTLATSGLDLEFGATVHGHGVGSVQKFDSDHPSRDLPILRPDYLSPPIYNSISGNSRSVVLDLEYQCINSQPALILDCPHEIRCPSLRLSNPDANQDSYNFWQQLLLGPSESCRMSDMTLTGS